MVRNSDITLSSSTGKWIMSSAILASAMAFIDGTALNVALPSLQNDLHASGADLFWILNSYLLMLAALVLPGGALGDKLGRKKIFMTGIVIFIAASVACGFSISVFSLIAFRAVQGIGGAMMIPGSLSLIAASFSKDETGKAIGTWSSVTTLVTVGGPVIGGILADSGLWRMIFFINVPIGIVSLIILRKKVPESIDVNAGKSVDYIGSAVVISGLALITYGFLRIPDIGFYNYEVIASLAAGFISMGAFIFIEKKSKDPMMPLNLFSNKTFSGANLLTFFLYGGLFAGMLFISLYMVQVQGYSQLQAGLTFLPFTVLIFVNSRWAGSLVDRYGPRWLLIGGPATAGAGLLLLSFVKHTSGPSDYWTTFFPGIFVFGLGMSFTVTPLTATVMGALPAQHSGTASGINNAISRISNVLANAVFGFLAILFFTGYLTDSIKNIPLNEKEKKDVIAQSVNLGDAKVPESVTGENKKLIEQAYKESFTDAYSKVLLISAGLAFLSAMMSFAFIKRDCLHEKNLKGKMVNKVCLNLEAPSSHLAEH